MLRQYRRCLTVLETRVRSLERRQRLSLLHAIRPTTNGQRSLGDSQLTTYKGHVVVLHRTLRNGDVIGTNVRLRRSRAADFRLTVQRATLHGIFKRRVGISVLTAHALHCHSNGVCIGNSQLTCDILDFIVLGFRTADSHVVSTRRTCRSRRSGQRRLLCQYRLSLTILETRICCNKRWQLLALLYAIRPAANRQRSLGNRECTIDIRIATIRHTTFLDYYRVGADGRSCSSLATDLGLPYYRCALRGISKHRIGLAVLPAIALGRNGHGHHSCLNGYLKRLVGPLALVAAHLGHHLRLDGSRLCTDHRIGSGMQRHIYQCPIHP